ncbi:MFS transporter [Amycolatopsis circi]|uniref:MFS transporter n=1 Tax=Amycolatopsis circi TaxID=871959 RepID=UPI0013BE8D8E|nr:MFS transporter [Amycolatopsis circi]
MSDNDAVHAGLRRAIVSAAIGQFVEWYDFVVYSYTASVLATLFFPAGNRVTSLLATFAVYGVAFVMRPLGGIVFGHLGDRFGRRGVLAAVILLMGAATAGIGLIPPHSRIGVLAPLLLVLCRLVQGLSAGGEAMGSNALVAEHAPSRDRGRYVAFTYAFAILPGVFAALFVLLLTTVMPSQAWQTWGWRIPFLVGGVLCLVGLYIRSRVDESPAFRALKTTRRTAKAPILVVLREHRRALGYAFALASLSGLGFYTLTGYFTTYLAESVGLTGRASLISNCVALTLAFVVMPLAGRASDRWGRRPVVIASAAATALLSLPAYLLASAGSLATAVAGQCMLSLAFGVFFGTVGTVYLELFPTRVRYSGSSLAYNMAFVVFGGTAPLFSTWLVDATGSLLAPAWYMTALAAIVCAVAIRLPETHRTSLVHEQDTPNDATGSHNEHDPAAPA